LAHFGDRLDVLVNNAGVVLAAYGAEVLCIDRDLTSAQHTAALHARWDLTPI
jgi:hypothetical protein